MTTQLYRVKVKGGGTFLYDTIDAGRLILKMAEAGDDRRFTVTPQSRFSRALVWLALRVERGWKS